MRVFAVHHDVLPTCTKVQIEEDLPWGARGELFYWIPPVRTESLLQLEVFDAPSTSAVLASTQQWIMARFGSAVSFAELPEED